MALALMVAIQAASAMPAQAQPDGVLPLTFDLAEVSAQEREQLCGTSDGVEIVVCGNRDAGSGGDPRMARWSLMFAREPLVAETSLGNGVTGRVFTEQVEFPRGDVSRRAMVGIRLPF